MLLAAPDVDLRARGPRSRAGRSTSATLLREHGLAVDAGLLQPWSRWVTPAGESRRYDTRFFVGALPAGAEPANVTSESSRPWVAVGDAWNRRSAGNAS